MPSDPRHTIAIVGVACRLPGGVRQTHDLWCRLAEGHDAVQEVPPQRWDPGAFHAPRFGAFLEDVDAFDAALFGIAPREATTMDPQQRLLLEVAWEALERAGVPPDRAPERTGVYVGIGLTDYARRTFLADAAHLDPWTGTGAFDAVAAGRISYALGLRGPALAVHTACSSSLVAVHLAVQALRSGHVDLALAGGVNLLLAPEPSVYFSLLHALSSDGRCRTFDAAASGYGRGEGVALLALVRCEDLGERTALALVRGTAVNQDGRTHGLTAPSGRAQQEVLRAALADAHLDPEHVGYVEAHGTGTPLGDPIEWDALRAVYGPGAAPCRVGSLKTNLGHLEAAAGVAGLLKAALALKHGQIPRHLHLEHLNPRIRLDGRLQIPTAHTAAPDLRFAAVSAFGMSGTNAHVILEKAPPPQARTPDPGPHLLVLSADRPEALDDARARWARADAPLADLARTAAVGRAHLRHRLAVVVDAPEDLGPKLALAAPRPKARRPGVVFAFTGQGSQSVGMATDLLRDPVFAAAFDDVDRRFQALRGRSLRDVLDSDDVHRTEWTQPALFAVGWALAQRVRAWGVEPDAVVGHSVGEIAAAAVAGVLSLDDAVRLVEARARHIGALPPGGAMAAVRHLPAELPEGVDVAAYNAPDEVVLSGDPERLATLDGKPLHVSHAFHSARMAPAIAPFRAEIDHLSFAAPELPWATSDGTLAPSVDADWWASRIRAPVHFADAVRALVAEGHTTFLELGPAPILAGLGPRIAPDTRWIPALRAQRQRAALLEAVGQLWVEGLPVRLEDVVHGRLTDAPTYPFVRDRFWIDPPTPARPPTLPDAWRIRWVPVPASAPPTAQVVVAGPDARATLAALRAKLDTPVVVVTRHAVSVAGEPVDPEQAAVWGFGAVAALEHPDTFVGLVDTDGDVLATGEDRLAVRDGRVYAERLVPEQLRPAPFEARGAWLITGGTGAMGRAVAERLARRGASRLILLSRSGGPAPDLPVPVEVVRVDVADRDALAAVLPPDLGGVVHCAGDVDDPWPAKALGTRHLDALVDVPLVVMGSIAGIWGSAGLADYAAANRYAEAVVQARRAAGKPGLAISWGPWATGGMVSAEALARFARMGLPALDPAAALDAFEAAFSSHPHLIVANADWRRLRPVLEARRPRPQLPEAPASALPVPEAAIREAPSARVSIRARVAHHVAAVLGHPGPLDPTRGLFDLGLDSVMAVELAERLRADVFLRAQGTRDLSLQPTLAFDFPTIDALVAHLEGEGKVADGAPTRARADDPIAIVGLSCRFPGAPTPEDYWRLLLDGPSPLTSTDRWDPARWPLATDQGGWLDELDQFDPGFFGLGADEATAMDPQQRLLLEVTWEALERAGIGPHTLRDTAAGVFVGIGRSEYWRRAEQDEEVAAWSGSGNETSFAAGRIAWRLGLRGPALAVNTACSSSLVAVHLACEALRSGACDVAIAGGVNVVLDPEGSAWLTRIGALSPTGRCHTFDAAADGYVRSEGCGIVVLQRLTDATAALAVIRGSAVAHDGATSGLTVPSGPAQARVIREALARAGVAPEEIGVVECHGTGTPLGDPIEVGALREVHRHRAQPLVLHAAKATIGHTEAAAGVAGLIALVLAAHHQTVPGNRHLGTPNPKLPLDFPVAIPTTPTPWTGLGAVSAFGFSGTNAHLVLGPGHEAPAHAAPALFLLSGHTRAALEDHHRAALALADDPALPSTLARRSPQRVRAAVRDLSEPLVPLEATHHPRVAFLFTGQGAQHAGMGLALHAADAVFRDALDRCAAKLPFPLLEVLGDADRIDDTAYAQPALFAVAWALTERLRAWGVVPEAVLGHSIGSFVAAVVAGVLDLDDALALVTARGALMSELPAGGAMAAVAAPEAVVASALATTGVEIAAVNGPLETVISGYADPVDQTVAALAARGFRTQRLRVSHAFHSSRMVPMLTRFAQLVAAVPHRPPTLPWVRDLDGQWVERMDPADWVEHARRPVRFEDALRTLGDRGLDTFVEIGPRPVLSALGPQVLPNATFVPAHDPLAAIGQLWARGVAIPVDALFPKGRLAPLATTAFQRRRCWIDPQTEALPLQAIRWQPVSEGSRSESWVVHPSDVTHAVRAVRDALTQTPRPRLTLVTRGGVSVAGEDVDPDQAAIHGLLATLSLEHPELWPAIVDGDDWARGLGHREDRVAVREGVVYAPRLAPFTPRGPSRLDLGDTILVTGGTGALGSRVARWLRDRGATVRTLARHGGDIRCDVGDRDALAPHLAGVTGIVHCAGAASAARLADLDPDTLPDLLRAKVEGARNLDALAPQVPLVLFGSATAWLGLPGQAAYAMANAFLDGLAAHRRARGAPTVCIAWGPWQAGMADGRDWFHEGVVPQPDEVGLATLAEALRDPPPTVLAIRTEASFARRYPGRAPGLLGVEAAPEVSDLVRALRDMPARAHPMLAAHVRSELQRLVGRPVRDDEAFVEAGLDSVGAVELTRRLGAALGRALPVSVAFDHPRATDLAAHLLGLLQPEDTPPAPLPAVRADDPIAIVGMAFRVPGAESPDALWDLLLHRRIAVSEVPPERWDADVWPAQGGWLRDVDLFDPDFFGISPREAASLDPQQRLLLDAAWQALEDAGHASLAGADRTGVFLGVTDRGYLRRFAAPGAPLYPDAWAGTGNEPSFAAGRVSHALGLQGPTLAVNTTCSSALVALHLGVRALRSGECDRALVGAASLVLDPEDSAYLSVLNALSPTGRCHTFSSEADGYVRGEGVGVFVLSRLTDAVTRGDRVLAVVRGTAINHDGHASGLTVPSGPAQARVIRAALADAGVAPDEVAYLEAHGTGTPLGDPIELRAARSVYRGPLVVGAVKANLGHLELAAGAASLAKVILALHHENIPPQPEIGPLNPELPLDGVEIPTRARPWPRTATPRRAAISAFGLSGTNAHVILEEAPPSPEHTPTPLPPVAPTAAPVAERPIHLVCASVHDPTLDLCRALRDNVAPLPDLAFTLHTTRRHLPWRAAVVAPDRVAAVERLSLRTPVLARSQPRVAFLFTGQGSQYVGMARDLYAAHPEFRAALDRTGLDRTVLDDATRLGHTRWAQPAVFAVSHALATLWRGWGVTPEVVIGHSVGELAAATFAGVFSLEDGMSLVSARGELMGALPSGGGMAALQADEDTVRGLLVDRSEIAGINAPTETVIAGRDDAIEAVLAHAAAAGIEGRRLDVSHAFHSRKLEPMLGAWEQLVRGVVAHPPEIPLVSALTGDVVTETSAAWWRRHAREPVRFADAVRTARAMGIDTFVEVGPHPVLLGLGQRTVPDDCLWLPSLRRGADGLVELATSLGRYWERGGVVDWDAWDAPWSRMRRPLAPTPRAPRRFWLHGDRYATSWTYRVRVERRTLTPGPMPRLRVLMPDDPAIRAFGEALSAAIETGDDGIVDLRPLAGADPRTLIPTVPTWFVTRGADVDPDAAAVGGLARAVFTERPDLRGGHVDLDTLDVDALVAAIASGEEVVVCRDGTAVPVLERAPLPSSTFTTHGTWLVTGGLGGLGQRVAAWLAERGATRLVLTHTRPLEGRAPDVRVDVRIARVDVADASAMAELLADEQLTGVVHAAGITAPQALDAIDDDTWRRTLRPKVDGARVLDRLTRGHPLEHFVLYSSIASVWGSRELAAYATASAWLDGLARRRRAEGLPGLSLGWGPWADGGMVDAERAERLARMGQRVLPPDRALTLLGDAMAADAAHVVVASVAWPRFLARIEAEQPRTLFDGVRPAAPPPRTMAPVAPAEVAPAAEVADVRGRVTALVRSALRWEPGRPLPDDQPLMELGFDSLMATELRNALRTDGLDVPLGRLLGGPSVEEIVVMVEARVAPETPEVAAPTPLDDDIPSWMVWTHLAAALVGAAALAGLWTLIGRLSLGG